MLNDPYYIVKSEVDQAVNGISVLWQRWKGLIQTSNTMTDDEYMWTVREIRSGTDEMELDLRDLSDTVYAVEQNPIKFNISASELENRKNYIAKTQTFVKEVKKSLVSPEVIAKQQSDQRNNLMSVAKRQNAANNDNDNGNYKYTKLQDALDTDNTSFLQDQEQQQQMIMRDQDQDLGQLQKAVGTLGQIGLTINDELDSQHKLLDELGTEVDNTSGHMKQAQKKITKLLNDTVDKHQCICILVLVIILIGVITFIIYDLIK